MSSRGRIRVDRLGALAQPHGTPVSRAGRMQLREGGAIRVDVSSSTGIPGGGKFASRKSSAPPQLMQAPVSVLRLDETLKRIRAIAQVLNVPNERAAVEGVRLARHLIAEIQPSVVLAILQQMKSQEYVGLVAAWHTIAAVGDGTESYALCKATGEWLVARFDDLVREAQRGGVPSDPADGVATAAAWVERIATFTRHCSAAPRLVERLLPRVEGLWALLFFGGIARGVGHGDVQDKARLAMRWLTLPEGERAAAEETSCAKEIGSYIDRLIELASNEADGARRMAIVIAQTTPEHLAPLLARLEAAGNHARPLISAVRALQRTFRVPVRPASDLVHRRWLALPTTDRVCTQEQSPAGTLERFIDRILVLAHTDAETAKEMALALALGGPTEGLTELIASLPAIGSAAEPILNDIRNFVFSSFDEQLEAVQGLKVATDTKRYASWVWKARNQCFEEIILAHPNVEETRALVRELAEHDDHSHWARSLLARLAGKVDEQRTVVISEAKKEVVLEALLECHRDSEILAQANRQLAEMVVGRGWWNLSPGPS